MKILLTSLSLSLSLSIEYAVLYDYNLTEQANIIASLYNGVYASEESGNYLENNFQLITEVYSNTQISNYYSDEISESEKIKLFITQELIPNNPYLKYILILGDENSFPPIYSDCLFQPNEACPSDDLYAQTDINSIIPDISFGRIPSSDPTEVENFTTKLTNFLLNPSIGDWRDKAILIADDENKNNSSPSSEIQHTTNSDILYDILSPYMNVEILYGINYEPETTANGLSHSELNQEIINNINDGLALVNYIGHGDESSLSAEKIIDMERDIPQISVSKNKLGLWIVGTCKFGQYDNESCMAEELTLDSDGAIGVISTTRKIQSAYNICFLENLFNAYTNHFNSSSNEVIRIGDIMHFAKNATCNYYEGNIFHLFGDPALPIFSSKQATDYEFPPIPSDITIGDINSINIMDYNLGNIKVQFNDYETYDLITDINGDGSYDEGSDVQAVYTNPGLEIIDINFTENSCYNIPLDASCNDCNLKISAYYQNNNSYNGISYIRNNVDFINDINTLEISDNEGPEIIFKNGLLELYNNSIIQNNSKINIGLSDPSGINTYQGIGGHSPRYWFNDEIDSYLINLENFTYTNSCLGSGYTEITIPEKYHGLNTLHFEAFDNYNKRSYKSIELNITSINPEETIINNFLALPNPFKNNTYFTFQISNINVLPIDLELKIFDLNGNLIKTIKEENIDENFKTIAWNGTNNANSQISNGTYLVHIESYSRNGQSQVQKIFVTRMK